MRKLWNACRFASMRLEDYEPSNEVDLLPLDLWILSKLEKVVKEATIEFDYCRYMNAIDTTRNFVWHVFCDHYLEAIKHRLYGERIEKASAQWTLYYTVKRILQLLAPAMPHITEEIYNNMYAQNDYDSINTSTWPQVNESLIDEDAEKNGDIIIAVIRDIRREKNRQGVPLNAELDEVLIYAEDTQEAQALVLGIEDISATTKATNVKIQEGIGGKLEVERYSGVRFTISKKF
jgi:valyl-tRNA synthetase